MSNSVTSAILSTTTDLHTREAMLVGSYFESGWNATEHEVGGTGVGAFQLSAGGPAHTEAQAEDPVASAKIMLGAYQAAVKSIPASLWSSNPELAAEQAAVAAERPAQSYLSNYGQARLDQAWSATQGALKGETSTSGGGGGASTTGLLGDLNPADWGAALGKDVVTNSAEKLWSWLLDALGVKSLTDLMERGALIVFGAVLILVGLHSLLSDSGKASPKSQIQAVTSGAGTGAGASAGETAAETAAEVAVVA